MKTNNIKKNVLFIVICLLQSCFPSFGPTKETKQEFNYNNSVKIEWYKLIGILDQEFPDYIIASQDKRIDTICISTNIANLKLINDTIYIGFYGQPKRFQEMSFVKLNTFLQLKVFVDTTFLK